MKLLYRGLALLLAALLGVGCAVAAETDDVTEGEARWERLLSFVSEEYGGAWLWSEEDIFYARVKAEAFEQEKNGTPQDYTQVELLFLYDFNQAQLEEILSQTPSLYVLGLTDCTVEDFSSLKNMEFLETVELDWSEDLPRQLASLAKLPKLPGLSLGKVPTDADLEELVVLAELEWLELRFQDDTLCELLPLSKLPKLRSLTIYGGHERAIHTLPDLPLLEKFFVNAPMDPALLKHTPALRVLKMNYIPADADLAPLAALTRLEELVMTVSTSYEDGETPLPELPVLPNLRSLGLYGASSGSGSVISNLPDLPALERFDTNAEIDLALFQHTPALRVLSIVGTDDFSGISTLASLEEIYVEWRLPDDLSPLHDLPALRLLQIDTNHLIMDYLEQLEALHEARPDIEIVLYYCC